MSWPWVSRDRLDIVEAELAGYKKHEHEYTEKIQKLSDDHKAARAAGEEVAHRLAQCDLERKELKANFAKLAALSRALETKLKDCTEPPISRKELEKMTKLIAVLRSENEGLKRHVARSDESEQRLMERIRAFEQEAS
jgi:septal ring factor EnvC (AmiA/AmiB activator)